MVFRKMFAVDNSESEVTVDQVADAMEQGTHTLLDVREQDEWDDARIDGAILVPMSELTERIGEVPVDKPVHIMCHSGQRSLYAISILERAGHQNPKSMAGGIVAWAQSGKPITR